LQGMGRLSEAHASLAEARTEAVAVGSRRTEWRIFEALSKLEPDPSRAEALRQRARRAAEYIATHLGEEHAALQRSFLNLPDVRALLP